MDVKIYDIIRFFFKENFSQKRLFVILMSILIALLSFFLCHNQDWFGGLKSVYGNLPIAIFPLVCFLVSFLSLELICNKVSKHKQKEICRINELENRRKKAEAIVDTIKRLSNWQKSFLINNIVQGKSQIKSFEIGGYKAVWGCEMEALIDKRIISKISCSPEI